MLGGRKNKRGSKSGKSSDSPAAPKKPKVDVAEVEDDKNKTGTSFSPWEKALQNTLVLQNIFKFLPYKDLQACQYVDLPFWSSEAQYAITQRPLITILLYESVIKMKKMIDGKKFEFQVPDVADLLVQLENHGKDFEIWLSIGECNKKPESWPKFVEKFGYAVSCLDFRATQKMSQSDFKKLLRGFPNLSYLSLDLWVKLVWRSHKKNYPTGKSKSKSSSESDNSSLLPQIKSVSCGQVYDHIHPGFLMALSQMMPNLNNIYSFPLHCIPKAADDDDQLKLDKIRSITFPRFHNHDSDETVEKLSQLDNMNKIGLQVAHLPPDILPRGNSNRERTSCYRSWSSVLRNNQNTVEYLKIQLNSLTQTFEYPEMKAVKKLWLCSSNFEENPDNKFFVPGMDVDKTFPNLREVTLKSSFVKLFDFVKLFPEDAFTGNWFRGVTTLNLQMGNFTELDSLEKVGRIFPNVTNFSMNLNLGWLENRLDQILQMWPKLISLQLKVDVRKNSFSSRKFPLDSVFTGISWRKCNELRKNAKMGNDIEDYRQEFAISKMTDLKELTVVFVDKTSTASWSPLFSHVTPFYGFQLVPDLKVTFAIPWDSKFKQEFREMISPVEKYVIFNPDYYEPEDYYVHDPKY